MGKVDIEILSLDPVGISVGEQKIKVPLSENYFRLVLTINGHNYMVTQDGACVQKMGK